MWHYHERLCPGQGTSKNLSYHVRENIGYFLFICEKIYTILGYNEGPLQLQSCVYKKYKGTIYYINFSNYFNLKQGWEQQVEKKQQHKFSLDINELELYLASYIVRELYLTFHWISMNVFLNTKMNIVAIQYVLKHKSSESN